ncbi:MAG: AraC family ligand binding domain-containing protein, partial [Lachnospiraceae bacterium]|nr:AraC family ligand binding domain-containing protein [Lachnospiraceae bacterium]
MRKELLEKLRPVTEEERKILEERKEIQKDIYTATEEFTIDSRKMLEKGRVIDIRTHTRFTTFPKHSHNFIEILYMCEGHTFHKIDGMTDVELKAGELLFMNQLSSHEIEEAGENDIGINFIILPQFFDQVL